MITHYTVQVRRIENASEGITIQITKTAGANKSINVYLFVIQDAQINFEDGRFKEINTSGSFKMETNERADTLDSFELPKYPHCAIICGQTGCGKREYSGVFKYIVILVQPSNGTKHTKIVKDCDVRKPKTKNLIIVNPIVEVREANGSFMKKRSYKILRMFFKKYAGHQHYISLMTAVQQKKLTKKKDMLSELAFSGRHAEQSVWVISQRYNSVLKDLREQTKWLCMFYTKDRDSFDNCLRENDVIPTLEERQRIKEELKKKKHRKLILKTDQPTDYWLLN
ncbi:Hypothetical predicted protein [Mytilus galloprovincialis]|uniref:Uncharacterized protein n=1 Tax=Mytilus galloprovincialis TaxID=29158 RepID=A0A8B6CHC1_MYTGA|nr:Hypothetical predicted protein [Mytilus galloprovincialis]